MPAQKPTPELPSDDQILAAIERAVCHRARSEPAEALITIKQHLGIPHTGWTTRQLLPKLTSLETAGLIERSRRSSKDVWSLTPKGRNQLGAVRGEITLPEAPQHRRWRQARAAAAEHIAEFRADMRTVTEETISMLEADREADSTPWFKISDRLHASGRRLASAIYCLREWQEPHDATPDTDEAPYGQGMRRQIQTAPGDPAP